MQNKDTIEKNALDALPVLVLHHCLKGREGGCQDVLVALNLLVIKN